MQKDLLAELHLPKLDFKSIQNIVTKNSARLASLLKENTNYLKKTRTVSPHFKGIVKSMVSDGAEINSPLSIPKESIKTVKRKFILSNSFISSHNLKNGLKISCPPSTISKTPRIEPNAVQESNEQYIDKLKCTEIRSFSTNCFSNSNILSNKATFNTNTSTNIGLNSCSKPESFKNLVGRDSLRDNIEIQVNLSDTSNECSFSEPLSVNLDKEKTSQRQFLKRKSNFNSYAKNVIEPNNANDIDKQFESTSDFEKNSEPAFCVISEVIGNATDAFSSADDFQENAEETSETQLIIPKKTNDITKIKGWRRKQFFIEKPTTIEFYSIAKGSLTLKKKIELNNYKDLTPNHSEEPDKVENAFVCDSLDEFLDQEAELKIGFEIPHLYAEFGIKLTRDEIVSRPNLSEKDLKEVETRYCMPISSSCNVANFDEIKEENLKRPKRPFEDDMKPCKILKIEENEYEFGRRIQKLTDKMKIMSCEKYSDSNSLIGKFDRSESSKSFSNLKLLNKFIALVVYPGPSMPLHPIVQYHLAKIRSYRTIIDKNWANFAASAVLVNEKRYKRSVLPVQCCVKIEKNSTVVGDEDFQNVQQKINSTSLISKVESDSESKDFKDQFKLKKCSVVIEKLNPSIGCNSWCMEHNCYNCEPCGLAKPKFKKFKTQEMRKIKRNDEDPRETVIVSPRASFDKRIASLLAKKVRLLKYNGDTLTSIDCLKTLTPNTVEFIKLKFVKESLLTGYINIWYLKQDVPEVRSRAFLTFSQTPPVPNAINLKSSAFSLNNLPKVITEIISKNNSFDSNEYAILHCNGEIWEIHGSLNIAFGKNEKNVEQIFTSVELPELKKLQEIAFDILHVKAVKWWVLDLSQKFKLIEIKSGNLSTVIVRKKFIETMALNLFGFLPLKRESNNRVLGAYVIQRLLPFILIGPYYLLETHDLTLKGESSTVPFIYYGQENVTSNYPLKYFINSVIKNMEQNDKKLEGLWLYDKMNLDRTSYLEVVTSNLGGTLPNKYSSIDIEHGYSLNSLTNSSCSGSTSGLIKRKDGKEEFKKITVYLYFDIFELGFVEGELQFDNSVIISHPLDRRTKMKSHKIGDWFLGIIKRRIDFLPKDLVVRWFVTKHKEDLRDRRPFNRFFLGGAHVLTKNGVYYLLEMSESKIEKLGLNKSDVLKAIAESEVIKEVKALKQLADLLPNDPSRSLSMDEVLTETVKEIKMQKRLERTLKNKKIMAQREKLNLISHFLKTLNYSRIPFHFKMKMIETLDPYLRKDNEEFTDEFIKKLKMSRIGRKYFKRFGKNYYCAMKILDKNLKKVNQANTKKKNKSESEKLPTLADSNEKVSILKSSRASKKTSVALLSASSASKEKKADRPKYPELSIQIEKLNAISDRINSFKNIYSKVMKNSALEKDQTQENFKGKNNNKNDFVAQKSSDDGIAKSDGFGNITSSELPNNVKLAWKNWNVNKLGVA